MESAALRKVTWVDSNTHQGWHDPDAQHYKPLKVITVGWLVDETDDSVTLAGSAVFGDEYQVNGAMTIPKVCILNDKTLAKR